MIITNAIIPKKMNIYFFFFPMQIILCLTAFNYNTLLYPNANKYPQEHGVLLKYHLLYRSFGFINDAGNRPSNMAGAFLL